MKTACGGVCLLMCVLVSALALAQGAANPFVGRWALTLPNDGPGWLGVEQKDGHLVGGLLWYGGSVNPLDSVECNGDTLNAKIVKTVEKKDAAGKVTGTQVFTEILSCRVEGDTLKGARSNPGPDGKGTSKFEFTGKRIPPVPPAPDLSKVKFGDPIQLFNGKDLDGWELTVPTARNGWSVKDGILDNNPAQQEGKLHLGYGNLRTVKEFEDFNLTLEVNVPPDGNSGIYLRGIYEVQVADTYGQPIDPHNMGGIYSRIAPVIANEKPAGEWQTFDITLVDRHVNVILNGKTIIDNAPLEGCTGGALWSDEFKPGPIYLQGDHTGIKYRNIVITPVVK